MEKVAIWSTAGRGRPRKIQFMNRDHYEKLKDVILSRLNQQESISLMTILEQPSPFLKNEIGGEEISSLLILVKNDLVARGILKISFNPDRSQKIELKRRRLRNSMI